MIPMLLGSSGGAAVPPIPPSFMATDGQAWWDASDSTTLFTDEAGTTPAVANDAVVARINDLIGSRHLTSPESDERPLLKTASINGRASLLFDGVDDWMGVGSALTGASGSAFIVVRIVSPAVAQDFLSSNDDLQEGTAQDRHVSFGIYEGFEVSVSPQGKIHSTQMNADDQNIIESQTTNISANTTYLFEFHSTGTAYAQWINGVSQTVDAVLLPGPDDGDWFDDTANLDNTILGAMRKVGPAPLYPMNAYFCEAFYIARVLTSDERDQLEAYFMSKWGATAP